MQSLSLDRVEQAFNDWRSKRINRKSAIPLRLWEMAVALYPGHKSSEICKRLNLSGGQFKAQLVRKQACSTNGGGSEFVVASSGAPPLEFNPPVVLKETTITVQGINRSLTLKLATEDIPEVLPELAMLL